MVTLKSPREIEVMRRSGKITSRVLTDLMKAARPGMTTGELDALAEARIREAGGMPTFKGYNGFPARSARRSTMRSCTGFRVRASCATATCSRSISARRSSGYVSDSAVTIPVGNDLREARAACSKSRRSA